MRKDGYVVAVAGATGAVGEVMLRVLEERKFPVRRIKLLASERSVGKRLKFQGEPVAVEQLGDTAFGGVDIALFSAGASRSKEFGPAAARAGAVVVDNSSAFRMEPDIPLVVPEINAHAIAGYTRRGIIANPNCTTIVTLMAVAPLHRFSRVKRMVASSYQAVSGAGARALAEFEAQVRAWATGQPIKVEVFPYQIAFNVLPHIDVFQENGYTKEEMKLVWESRKILEDQALLVSPTTVRVPVFTAHSVSVHVETEAKISVAKARELFAAFPGLQVKDDPAKREYPMPLFAAGTDDCYVGRIREDLAVQNGLNFWVVGDQLRKGAALNAVQIAEVLAEKYL
ncbi:MAG TPA: aspartate-semialdehyde dehydrogenase [Candidatus Sulfotelmatobacter sp.]|nr:aspartate-semialdehyde dehydrogenase [Candidatus Sulfotelmatobacter sp.]